MTVSFDFQKGFDKKFWTAIEASLNHSGFSQFLRHMVEILHIRPVSCVLKMGSGAWFELQKSCWEGCPSSAVTFAIAVEILGIK